MAFFAKDCPSAGWENQKSARILHCFWQVIWHVILPALPFLLTERCQPEVKMFHIGNIRKSWSDKQRFSGAE